MFSALTLEQFLQNDPYFKRLGCIGYLMVLAPALAVAADGEVTPVTRDRLACYLAHRGSGILALFEDTTEISATPDGFANQVVSLALAMVVPIRSSDNQDPRSYFTVNHLQIETFQHLAAKTRGQRLSARSPRYAEHIYAVSLAIADIRGRNDLTNDALFFIAGSLGLV